MSDILEAFGATLATVEKGLQSSTTLNYLARIGFDLRGKSADDLNARETFELLSTREIKDKDQIVSVLSSLRDKLARERAAQAKDRSRRRKVRGTALLQPHERPTWMMAAGFAVEHPAVMSASRTSARFGPAKNVGDITPSGIGPPLVGVPT